MSDVFNTLTAEEKEFFQKLNYFNTTSNMIPNSNLFIFSKPPLILNEEKEEQSPQILEYINRNNIENKVEYYLKNNTSKPRELLRLLILFSTVCE